MRMVSSYLLVFLILAVRVSTKADDDVWIWGRDTDFLQGRQAEDVSRAIKFPEEDSIPDEVIPHKDPLIQGDSPSPLTTSPPISKFRAIEIQSQPFQSNGNVQQIHDFVSSSRFKPSLSFPQRLTQPLLNGKGTTVEQHQNFETIRNNQIFSPVSNTLLTGPSSNLQIIPAIQTASISQTFGENFPPFPEPSNSLQGKRPSDELELRERDQQIFGKSEPSKRSAIATENPIRSFAFVVPADISLLTLEEHETFSSSAPPSSQGRLLNSPVATSSFKRDAPSLSDVPATNQRPYLIQNLPTEVPRKSILATKFLPRENLLVKNLSSDSKINLAQSFLGVNESVLDQPNSKSTENGGGSNEGNATRFTRTINPEFQKIPKKESAQPNQIPVSSSLENTKEEEHAIYIIDIPNLETPKWPFTYFKNNEVIPKVLYVDKDDKDKRAVGSDNYSRTKVIKLTPSSIRTIRGSGESFPPTPPISTELDEFVRHRDPKNINTAFADLNNPISRFKSDFDDSQSASNVVNQNVFIPDNFYFPSETFQNQNIKTEKKFINVNTASSLQSEGYLNNNLGFQPISKPSDLTFGNFGESYQQPLIIHDSFVDNTGFSQSEHIPPNSIQQYETQKDIHSDRFEKEISSTYHAPLRVEIVKPNTLHTITDTVVDGKVITTFYDPLKVTIYKHGSPIEAKLFDASSVESKTHSEYNISPIIDLNSNSQPSYSSSNEIKESQKSVEVNHASVENDTATNTSDEYSSTGIREAFSQLEKSQQDNILSLMQRARGGYPDSSWIWPE